MVRFLVVICSVILAVQVSAADKKPQLKTKKDKMSYVIGLDLGNSFKKQELDVNADFVAKGIKDAVSGAKPLLSEQEIQEAFNELRNELVAKQMALRAKQQEELKAMAEKNKKEGEAFLAENAKKEGVKTLPSGLQYKVITEGTGKTPKATDIVTVNYKGTLVDGKEFDNSYKRGEPATFPVNGVIPGWVEALQLMKEGAKWQVFIPSNLAYGEAGAGGVIGPNAVLIFDVELISIKEADENKDEKK